MINECVGGRNGHLRIQMKMKFTKKKLESNPTECDILFSFDRN